MADRSLEDDDEDELDEDDAAPEDDLGGDEPAELDDGGTFDEDGEEEGSGGGRGRLILIAGVVAFLVIAVAGGAYFFFFSGGDEPETAAREPAAETALATDDGTMMALPRRGATPGEQPAKKAILKPPAPSSTAGSDPALTPPPPNAMTPSQKGAPPPAQGGETQAAAAASAPAMTPPPATKGQAPAKGAKGKSAPTAAEQPGIGLVTPAATAVAYRDIPLQPQGKPLTGPIASLIETTEAGQLPKVQGTQVPWRAYARPFDGPAERPKIAVIVVGLGLSRAPTLAAVNQLPGPVTLAFDPYARNIDEWLGLGRSNGHEALLHLPMEPSDFPVSDPGPLAMLTDFDAAQNLSRMHQILASAIGYVGVLQVMGSKFAASDAAMRPVLQEARKRGLLYVGMTTTSEDRGPAIAQEIQLPIVYPDLKVDAVPSASAIDAQLSALEKIAREQGRALALAEAYPVTIAKLATWAQTLDFKELTLAPVSAVVTIPAPPPPPADGKSAAKK